MKQSKKCAMGFPRVVLLLIVAIIIPLCNAQGLKFGYYERTCPGAEAIVKKTTAHYISRAPTLAAPLLRIHFHDCFVRVIHFHMLSFGT